MKSHSFLRILVKFKRQILYNSCCLLFVFTLAGCSSEQPHDKNMSTNVQEIKGRDYNGERFAIYRARVPNHWIRHDPLPNESLTDTTKAICEFVINEEDQIIRIAIHNFSSDSIDQRIPAMAQVTRWQRQFQSLSPTDTSIIPQVFNGYNGLLFKGIGRLNDQETLVMGWILQIAPVHYRVFSQSPNEQVNPHFRESRADVTIKAVGPKEFMEEHSDEIINFANSFELIEEIPTHS